MASCLALIASTGRTRRMISGAKFGMPGDPARRCPRSAYRRRSACRGWGCRRCRRRPPPPPARGPGRRRTSDWRPRGRLPVRTLLQLHAAAEGARAQPHEGDAVAVVGVHVRLDLEDEARDFAAAGLDRLRLGRLRPRRRRPGAERVEQLGDADALERRAEEHRRQVAAAKGVEVEGRAARRCAISSDSLRGRVVAAGPVLVARASGARCPPSRPVPASRRAGSAAA